MNQYLYKRGGNIYNLSIQLNGIPTPHGPTNLAAAHSLSQEQLGKEGNTTSRFELNEN